MMIILIVEQRKSVTVYWYGQFSYSDKYSQLYWVAACVTFLNSFLRPTLLIHCAKPADWI